MTDRPLAPGVSDNFFAGIAGHAKQAVKKEGAQLIRATVQSVTKKSGKRRAGIQRDYQVTADGITYKVASSMFPPKVGDMVYGIQTSGGFVVLYKEQTDNDAAEIKTQADEAMNITTETNAYQYSFIRWKWANGTPAGYAGMNPDGHMEIGSEFTDYVYAGPGGSNYVYAADFNSWGGHWLSAKAEYSWVQNNYYHYTTVDNTFVSYAHLGAYYYSAATSDGRYAFAGHGHGNHWHRVTVAALNTPTDTTYMIT